MKENHYSIKDLENLTHIKAHTIRIWEQRYKLFSPQRTSTNIRYYTDNDLRKILNVNMLYTNGLKISRIASLSEDEIVSKVNELISEKGNVSDLVQKLINFTMQLNISGISELLEKQLNDQGMESFYAEVLVPTFTRIGELWQLKSLSVGHEHFFTNIARNFIISKTNGIQPEKTNNKTVLLYLHAGEEHEISLLVYNYLLTEAGYTCYYLGQNTPMTDFEVIFKQIDPSFVITNFVKYITEEQFKEVIDELYKIVEPKKVVIGGFQSINYQKLIHKESTLIQSNKDLKIFFV